MRTRTTIPVLLLIVVSVTCRDASLSPDHRAGIMDGAWNSIYGYDGFFRRLPRDVTDSSGKPIASWRFVVADRDGLRAPYDKTIPWNAEGNRGARSVPYPVFRFGPYSEETSALYTDVLAICGRGTAFDETSPRRLAALPNDLLLLIECRGTGIHWMEPGDVDIDRRENIPTTGIDGCGFMIAFADGAIWHVRSDVPQHTLRLFCTVHGAETHDRNIELAPFAKEFVAPKLPIANDGP